MLALFQAKIKAIFFALDTDNSGSIDTDELEEVLKHLGVTDAEERQRQVTMAEVEGATMG